MRLFGRRRARPRVATLPAIAPETSFIAVGDIHGRLDLLEQLLTKIDVAGLGGGALVFVGDYIDRGPLGLEVVAQLEEMTRSRETECVCLRGNHEQMLLDFLDRPELAGRRWVVHGGLNTLLGCGLEPVSNRASSEDWQSLRDALRERLGDASERWLRGLPTMWRNGNIAVVHAAADPAERLDQQEERHLVWGHPDFLTMPRVDGNWVVHGHTIVESPQVRGGRIAIDTGAYATERLTAALVSRGQLEFMML